MRIIQIDIDGFGTLSNYHINMDENPVIIMQDNGWGKSTLASFIRVMFYGFADETKKSVSDRERNRLRPWNHGIYGGTIIFEYNKKQYRLQRTFGMKANEDTCSLVDITTKLRCNEFDTSNLGLQIMGIDAESYIRTMHIGQSKLSVRNDKGNLEDGITAKIGNLTEATDDINNFDNVMERLKKECNSLKSGNKKGIINELNAMRDGLVANQNSYKLILEDISKSDEYLKELKENLVSCSDEIARVDREYTNLGKNQMQQNRLERQRTLREELETIQTSINKIRETLSVRIPDSKEIDAMIATIKSAESLREKCNNYGKLSDKLKSTESTLEGENNKPDVSEIESVQSVLAGRKECQSRLADVTRQYDKDSEILRYRKDTEIREWNRSKEKAEEDYRLRLDNISRNFNTYIAIDIIGTIVMMTLCCIAYLALKNMFTLALAGVCLMTGIITGLVIRSNCNKKKADISPQKISKEPDFADEERVLAKKLDEKQILSDRLEVLNNQIMEFCSKYQMVDDAMLEMKLFNMSQNNTTSDSDKTISHEYHEAKVEYEKLSVEINNWFEGIAGMEVDEWLETAIGYRQILSQYKTDLSRMDELKQELENIQSQPVEEYGDIRDVDSIVRDRDELNGRIDTIKENISKTEERLKELRNQKRTLEEEKEKLDSIDENLGDYRHKYDIINKTMGFLGKAKEKLSSRYIDPIEDAFIKYYSYITTEFIDCYEIDADIKLTRQEAGQRRDGENLSMGYKDLVDVSLRMALLDVMYEGEKPWIIMDDPFVNLDTSKLCQVKTFLNEIAKDYQVIYFTCHESRA